MFEEINPYIIFASRKTTSPNIPFYKKRKVWCFELELITTGGGYIETDGKSGSLKKTLKLNHVLHIENLNLIELLWYW